MNKWLQVVGLGKGVGCMLTGAALAILGIALVMLALRGCAAVPDIVTGTVVEQHSVVTAQGLEYRITILLRDKIGQPQQVTVAITDKEFLPYPYGCTAIINLNDNGYRIVK